MRKVRSENKKCNYFTCTVDGELNNFPVGFECMTGSYVASSTKREKR